MPRVLLQAAETWILWMMRRKMTDTLHYSLASLTLYVEVAELLVLRPGKSGFQNVKIPDTFAALGGGEAAHEHRGLVRAGGQPHLSDGDGDTSLHEFQAPHCPS